MFHVLPYNYNIFVPLINEWVTKRGRITANWRDKVEQYMQNTPFYYVQV